MTDTNPKTPHTLAPNWKCVILVPVGTAIDQECDAALRTLERRNYVVRRRHGFSAIDQARSTMATEALDDGFRELMWIDADSRFNPDDVDQLRALDLPVVGGVYPKRGARALTLEPLPGVKELLFGVEGSVQEVLFCGCGFLYTRAEVYRDIIEKLDLPASNQRYKRSVYPFFLPMVVPDPEFAADAHLYLCEDYAFEERARQSGHHIHVDTRLRIGHVGTYGYTWEEAGGLMSRHPRYRFVFGDR